MARRMLAAITSALRTEREEQVHIHAGPFGRPYVCDDPRCTSPSMVPDASS
jgi:hypothetical protein